MNARPRTRGHEVAAGAICTIAVTCIGCGSGASAGSAEDAQAGGATDAGIPPAAEDGALLAIDATRSMSGGRGDAGQAGQADEAGQEGQGTPPSGSDTGAPTGSDGSTSAPGSAPLFSAYKDTGIQMNWNTNVISTNVSGKATALASDLGAHGAKAITLAFATGECGSESWGGVPGGDLASVNLPLLTEAGVDYVVSTGGAGGSFTCATDAAFETFVGRWTSAHLRGIDFDIEVGQSDSVVGDLVDRIQAAHGAHPMLRFSLTLATLANNNGASSAQSLSPSPPDSFNTTGDETMAAVKRVLGFSGDASTWPSYLFVNLMTMDYGSPSAGVCVVKSGACDMGQSALQAAYNLHDRWGVPYDHVELTPMIGGNDTSSERFELADADAVAAFAIARGLAGIHYWSYDRDVDCASSSASATCNSMGATYAGPYGYLKRFLRAGLR